MCPCQLERSRVKVFTFYTTKGHGAFLNNEKVYTSRQTALSNAIIDVEVLYNPLIPLELSLTDSFRGVLTDKRGGLFNYGCQFRPRALQQRPCCLNLASYTGPGLSKRREFIVSPICRAINAPT